MKLNDKRKFDGNSFKKKYYSLMLFLAFFMSVFIYLGFDRNKNAFIGAFIFLVIIFIMFVNLRLEIVYRRINKDQSQIFEKNAFNPDVISTANENEILKPPFRTVVHSRNNFPDLSNEAEELWNTLNKRYNKRTSIYRWGLIVVVTLIFLFYHFVEHRNMDVFFSSEIFAFLILFTIIDLIFLGYSNKSTGLNHVFPILLALGWMSASYYFALKGLFNHDTDVKFYQETFSISGGIIIFLVWGFYLKIRLKKLASDYNKESPVKLLFLWVFGTDATVNFIQFHGYKWQHLGPVMFINGEGLLNVNSLKMIWNWPRRKNQIIQNTNDVERIKKNYRLYPSSFGTYQNVSVLCSNSIWKFALSEFIKNKDLVLMSLCGFTSENKGCEFELNKLINEVPTEKFILIIDETTDKSFLEKTLRLEWKKMLKTSPNLRNAPSAIVMYQMQQKKSERNFKDDKSIFTSIKEYRIAAADSRAIIKLLCIAAVKET